MKQMGFVNWDNEAVCLWDVDSVNDWQQDFELGREFATEFITALRTQRCTPYFLTDIIRAMPDDPGTIEHGFLTEISSHLM